MFCTVVGALRDAGVDVGEAKQGPPEHRHREQPRPAEPGRADHGHVLVGHERAVRMVSLLTEARMPRATQVCSTR
jgi:hypothetical protein